MITLMEPEPTEKSKELTFDEFKSLAGDESLSAYEKIGFPNSYRHGKEELIFQDIVRKLPNLNKDGQTVLDIGPGCSFGYGTVVFVNTLLGRSEVRGFATIVALIAFLLGLVIIMLGIIGEYLWRIFDETNKRPEAVIDEIY